MIATRNIARNNKASGLGAFSNLRWTCSHCGKQLETKRVVLFGSPQVVPCWGSCGCDESKWDGTTILPSQRDWARAGIPERYINAECDLRGKLHEVESGKSLYIHGPYGAGKTYFACALAKSLINIGTYTRFENSRHLMTEIQGMFNGKQTNALDRAFGCRVLVLDDLGKEQVTPYSISMLYELIDARYMDGKPIVITSNFSRDKLLERWANADASTAESIVSRLCDGVETMFFDGEDRRLA